MTSTKLFHPIHRPIWSRVDDASFGGAAVSATAALKALLFGASEVGVFYTPWDKSTLWQDAAGTVAVTASGDPVRRMDDISGNAKHATASSDAKRPVYTEGGGLAYLLFDGTDDGMGTAAIDFSANDEMTIHSGIRKLDSDQGMLVELSTDASGVLSGLFWILINYPGVSQYQFASKGSTQKTATTAASYVSPVSNVITATRDISEPMCRIRVDNSSWTSTATTQGTGVGSVAQSLFIGARNNGAAFWCGMQFFGMIVRGKTSTDAQLASAESLFATKSGVTLL